MDALPTSVRLGADLLASGADLLASGADLLVSGADLLVSGAGLFHSRAVLCGLEADRLRLKVDLVGHEAARHRSGAILE